MYRSTFTNKVRSGIKIFVTLIIVGMAIMTVMAKPKDPTEDKIELKKDEAIIGAVITCPITPPPITEIEVTPPPRKETPILFPDLQYNELFDIDASNDYINIVFSSIQDLEAAIDSQEFTEEASALMIQEHLRLSDIIPRLEADIGRYTKWEQEHYYAAKTWNFFRRHGYSEAVTAGIIGNLMIETSGGTLNIKPEIYSSNLGYYGLCQWSLYYKPFMAGKSFTDQLKYLDEDMSKEFKTFGFCYKTGFTYEDFLALEEAEQAALAFAKVYERCGAGSYSMRQTAAKTAYNYFMLGE